jgi:nucleotide-binding universal stress UspA family protein
MQEARRILVPVDGSENSDKAVVQAADLAKVCTAVIDLLYVSYFDSGTDDIVENVSWLPDSVTGSIGKTSKAILEHAKTLIPENIEMRLHIETGIPAKKILDFAKHNKADLIVIGGRGLGIVEGFLLGSVSQKIIEQADCPVLIVK